MVQVIIGIATYKRPKMLRNLLRSIEQASWPDNFSVEIVIVENEFGNTLRGLAQEFAGLIQRAPITLACEGRRGIVFARNRVLDIALEKGADYLTFVDDDELVAHDWLEKLVNGCRKGRFDMAGGPAIPQPYEPLQSLSEKMVYADMLKNSRRHMKITADRQARGEFSTTPLSTNNWIARLDFVRKNNLRFDERIGLGSASDIRFFDAALLCGAVTGWVPDAIVHDCLPRERLTFRFQFKRALTDGMASAEGQLRRHGKIDHAKLWNTLLRRIISTPFKLALSLATGGNRSVRTIVTFGDVVGSVLYTMGARNQAYRHVTGK